VTNKKLYASPSPANGGQHITQYQKIMKKAVQATTDENHSGATTNPTKAVLYVSLNTNNRVISYTQKFPVKEIMPAYKQY
jgi:hypothetical protein